MRALRVKNDRRRFGGFIRRGLFECSRISNKSHPPGMNPLRGPRVFGSRTRCDIALHRESLDSPRRALTRDSNFTISRCARAPRAIPDFPRLSVPELFHLDTPPDLPRCDATRCVPNSREFRESSDPRESPGIPEPALYPRLYPPRGNNISREKERIFH